MITREEVQSALPTKMRSAATQELTDKLNRITTDPEFNKQVRDNFISYTSVLNEGRFKISDYLNAVVYVSLQLLSMSNQDAYKRAFPDRYQTLVARGADDQEISSYVAAYNKNKLVNLIREQTLIPTWVLNAHVYQNAINHQAWLMQNAKSEKVQSDAANSILTHLKRPETKHQLDLNLGVQENQGLAELQGMLLNLAQHQRDAIGQGVNTKTIAHQDLVPSDKRDISKAEEAEIVNVPPKTTLE